MFTANSSTHPIFKVHLMKAILLAILFSLASTAHAGAYEDNLKKLFELTGVINSYISLNTQVINQMQTGYLRAADQNIDSSSFTTAQKQQAGEILKKQFATMVKDYESHVKLSMPYDKVVDEIYIPLYKETYSPNDVQELLIFYQSPLGKKTLEFSRTASEEISKRTAASYEKIIFDFVKKQIDENIVIVKREIASQIK